MNQSGMPCCITEYTAQFLKHQQSRRQSIQPPQKAIAHDAKFSSETTNRKDFVVHPITPPLMKESIEYHPPEGVIDTTSEYKNKFMGKWSDPVKPIKPIQSKRDGTMPFQNSTTHGTDFTAPPITPRKVYTSQYTYEPPKDSFDATSTARSHYVDYGKTPVTPSCKPCNKAALSTQPFDSVSSYHSTFTLPAMPERFQKPKTEYVPSKKEFSSSTTFRSEYPKHSFIKPRESMKPTQKLQDNKSPFEKTTTNRLAYKAWEIPERVSRPATVYVPSSDKVSSDTTFKMDFPDYGHVSPTVSCKVVPKREEIPPFQGFTTQSTDFKAWNNAERPPAIRQDKKYTPPMDKFDAITTSRDHYKGEYAPPMPSTKPHDKAYSRSSKMESSTSYKASYSRSGYKPCPAALLDDSAKSKYVYSHEDSVRGHKLYTPINSNVAVA